MVYIYGMLISIRLTAVGKNLTCYFRTTPVNYNICGDTSLRLGSFIQFSENYIIMAMQDLRYQTCLFVPHATEWEK